MQVNWPPAYVAPGVEDNGISGLVVEYIVAIDVTRVRFPADAWRVGACREICRLSVPTVCVEEQTPIPAHRFLT